MDAWSVKTEMKFGLFVQEQLEIIQSASCWTADILCQMGLTGSGSAQLFFATSPLAF